MDKVATGIPGLDQITKGGFRRNSVNLLLGGTGSGKTILSMQFIVDGIQKYKEPGVFVSYEEDKQEVYDTMKNLGWNLRQYEKEGMFAYVQTTPEEIEKIVLTGGGEVREIIEKIKAKRLVIDSITAFMILTKDELIRREEALKLFRMISKWGCTALIVSENEVMTQHPTATDIEYEADGILILYNLVKGGVRKRAIEVLKIRDSEHADKIFEMDITAHGIVVHPHKVLKVG